MGIFQFRRGTPAAARDANRVLSSGEPGLERAAAGAPARLKLGDGVTAWRDLPWTADGVSVQTIPGLYTSYDDNAPAIQAAIDAAPPGTTLLLPPGTFKIRATVNLGGRKKLVGGNAGFGSVLQADAVLPIMLTADSSAVVEDICLSGDGKADWGFKSAAQPNKLHLQRVRVEGCTGAGFVFEAAQNGFAIDCIAQQNLVNYLLLNGVANFKFINCNSNLVDSGDANARAILIANSNDSRLTGTVYAGGNRCISWFGGILERGGLGHPMVAITDGTGYVSLTEVEIASGGEAAVHAGSAFTGRVMLNRVSFALSGSNHAVVAEGGVIHNDHSTYSGTGGRAEDLLYDITGTASMTTAIDSGTVPPNILGAKNSFFRYGIGAWVASGGGAAAWDSTGWRMTVTSTGAGNGAKCSFGVQTSVAAGRLARITFYIQAITGATEMTVRAATDAGQKALNTSGNYGVGEHTITTVLDGDETGILIAAGSATATTISVAYITINII